MVKEGYYAYSLGDSAPQSTSFPTPRQTAVRFFAVDSEGGVRPGAWSCGTAVTSLPEHGKPQPVTQDPRLGGADAVLWRDYLLPLD